MTIFGKAAGAAMVLVSVLVSRLPSIAIIRLLWPVAMILVLVALLSGMDVLFVYAALVGHVLLLVEETSKIGRRCRDDG